MTGAFRTADPGPSVASVATVAVANAEKWENAEPILADEGPSRYPVESLPAILRDAVLEVGAFSQAPIELVACSALASLSLSGQHLCTVERTEGLDGPASLYLLVLAESGERKSAVDQKFTAPIRAYELGAAEKAKPDFAAYRADLRAWEAKVKGIESKIQASVKSGKSTSADEEALRNLEESRPSPPRVPRVLYTDATPEALTVGLAERWPSAGVMSAEAGNVLGGHGMGKDSQMRAFAMLNSAWDGDLAPSDRITRESTGPRNVRLTCGLAAQPEAVRTFVQSSKGLARGSGLLARFLVARPASTQGTRLFKDAPQGWPALASFHDRLTELLEAPACFEDGNLQPATLRFANQARKRWQAFHDDIERELAPGGMMATARDFASKAADNAARMAGLFHLLEHGPGGSIGLEAVEAAAAVVAWHCLEAVRFVGDTATPVEISNAIVLDGWLAIRAKATGSTTIPRRDIQRLGPGCVRDKDSLNKAMQVLADVNRARFETVDRQPIVAINPMLTGGV